jgi:hypothetical protein
MPLSVTVNNRPEGEKYHFAKPTRQVSSQFCLISENNKSAVLLDDGCRIL